MGLFNFLNKKKEEPSTSQAVKPATTQTAKTATQTVKPITQTAKTATQTVKPITQTAKTTTQTAKPIPQTAKTTTQTAKTTTQTVSSVKPAPNIKPTGKLQIVIDGIPILFSDGDPYVEGNDVMVPIRELANHLGAKVGWDDATKTATLSKDDEKVEIVPGATTAKVNGKVVSTGAVATLKNERIFLPIKFLAENLGASYKYDSINKIASIS